MSPPHIYTWAMFVNYDAFGRLGHTRYLHVYIYTCKYNIYDVYMYIYIYHIYIHIGRTGRRTARPSHGTSGGSRASCHTSMVNVETHADIYTYMCRYKHTDMYIYIYIHTWTMVVNYDAFWRLGAHPIFICIWGWDIDYCGPASWGNHLKNWAKQYHALLPMYTWQSGA